MLGEFEYLLITAAAGLGENAYGAAIREEIETTTGRRCSIGVDTTIDRLESKASSSPGWGGHSAARWSCQAHGSCDSRRCACSERFLQSSYPNQPKRLLDVKQNRGERYMSAGWRLVDLASCLLERNEREAVLGDLIETRELPGPAVMGVLGLVLRRQADPWKSWRPWRPGFGVALPSSYLLMGASLSVAWSYMRLLCPEMLAQASLTKPSAVLVLLWHAFLLIGWSWTGGFVVGSVLRANSVGEHTSVLFALSTLFMAFSR